MVIVAGNGCRPVCEAGMIEKSNVRS